MKTTKEVLDSCNDFTLYNHYNKERVVELNHIRDCKINVPPKCNHNDENLQIRVSGSINDRSLMFIKRNVEKLVHELKNWEMASHSYFAHKSCEKKKQRKKINLLIQSKMKRISNMIKKCFHFKEWV